MSVTIAVLSLMAALIPVVLYILKRSRSPSAAEIARDADAQVERELVDIIHQIAEHRRRGDHAMADALLRRLRDHDGDPPRKPAHTAGANGQRHPIDTAGGNRDPAP